MIALLNPVRLCAMVAFLMVSPAAMAQQGQVPAEVATRLNTLMLSCRALGGQPVRGARPVAQPLDLTGDGRPDWVIEERAFACNGRNPLLARPLGTRVTVLVDDGHGRMIPAWEGRPAEVVVSRERAAVFIAEGGAECRASQAAALACARVLRWEPAARRMIASADLPGRAGGPAASPGSPPAASAGTASVAWAEAGEGCPATAAIDQYARRKDAAYVGSDTFCGDFDGDGQTDAVAFMNFATGGNSNTHEVGLFRSVGGSVRHVREVPELYGQPQVAQIAPGRIVLRMMTMLANDARCCPSGRTRVEIDLATGKFRSAPMPQLPLTAVAAGSYNSGSCGRPRETLVYDGRTLAYRRGANARPARALGTVTRDGSGFMIDLPRAGGAPAGQVQIEPVAPGAFLFVSDFEGAEGDPLFSLMRLCPGAKPLAAAAPSAPPPAQPGGTDATAAGFPFRVGVYTNNGKCDANAGGYVEFMKDSLHEWEADQDTSFARIAQLAPGKFRFAEVFNSDDGPGEPETVEYERLGPNSFRRTTTRVWDERSERMVPGRRIETYIYCQPLDR